MIKKIKQYLIAANAKYRNLSDAEKNEVLVGVINRVAFGAFTVILMISVTNDIIKLRESNPNRA